MPIRLGAALVAEFVGTFALCCVGILGIHFSHGNIVAVALAHGLILSVMVTAAMPTSGGHFNPAVTFGFLITGKIKPVAAVGYIAIQLLAGVIAALCVFTFFKDGGDVVYQGTPNLAQRPGGAVSGWIGLLAEIVATFFLVFAVWGSAADPRARDVGGFAIGLTVAADILAFGGITGASMNPARSFGPTLIAMLTRTDNALTSTSPSLWSNHWVYWAGPLIGASLAAIIYHLVLWPRDMLRGVDPGAADVPPTQRP